MRGLFYLLLFASIANLQAAPPEKSCGNMEALIGFVENHIQNALDASEVKMTKYHTYKALNVLVKSEDNFGSCSCDIALNSLRESQAGLKLATRVSTLDGARILLRRALEDIRASEDALEEHDSVHAGPYDDGVLAMNTLGNYEVQGVSERSVRSLESKIDQSLVAYQKSLEEVVRSVPCDEALEFVNRVYAHCEKQLLRQNLSAAKRYYNIKTKEITERALEDLQGCSE